MQKITPFLWFDNQAGEAAKFYTSVFRGSKIKNATTLHNTPSGTVEIITIELFGNELQLMSAGPLFQFNESVSFVVNCETQEEVDYYWEKLSADPKAEQCGWLKDKFGLSWQVVPTAVNTMLAAKDSKKRGRMMQALLQMKKLDIKKLQQAFDQQ